MRPVKDHWAVAIDITTRCNRSCANCTRGMRFVKHADRDTESIESALRSLQGWNGGVVCIGGEPTLHSDFLTVCELWHWHVPRWRSALFYGKKITDPIVSGYVEQAFGVRNYNDHYGGSWHQPVLVHSRDLGISSFDIVRNVNRCWLNWNWCPVIVPGVGAYFCEVAATIDNLLSGGRGAVPPHPGWWESEQLFTGQHGLCEWCGIPHGLQAMRDTDKRDAISPRWADVLNVKRTQVSTWAMPGEHVHYARPDGEHHTRKRGLRIWLRQKWFGAGYRIRKHIAWPLLERLHS